MFISYAQNFEDVMLRRVLKHVENGFYIDVGAQDPVGDSVSKAFHDLGWKGIHVEPTPEYAGRLRAERQGDLVIEAIIGPKVPNAVVYQFEGTGLSTTVANLAEMHVASNFAMKKLDVASVTLDELLDMRGNDDIHWLKIDTEGSEAAVIASWEKSAARPWVIVVESVDPISHQVNSAPWEFHLEAKGYRNVYFDGVNKFYLSKEHDDLAERFSAPPNLFDSFALSGTASSPFTTKLAIQIDQMRAQAEDAAREHAALTLERDRLIAAIAEVESRADWWQRQVEVVYNSTSWRITMPLRVFARLLKRISVDARRIPHFAIRVLSGILFRLAAFSRRRFPGLFYKLATNPVARKIFNRFKRTQYSQLALTAARGATVYRNPSDEAGVDVLPALLSRVAPWKPGKRIDA